ncbi:hypothetical protein HNP60_002110 [Sphingobium sp. B1D3A]|uniref:Uncharacterized protein n=1 Tax=Sphingobium lignivorans TaxID=2735886 RepID=A0ABR6NGC8_9SPHN|nr:hypothetical protein [Sphingobium lignivorans]
MRRRFGSRLRHLEIAAADNAAARHDFAHRAGRKDVAVIVHQFHADGVGGAAAARQALGMLASRGGGHDLGREPGGDHVALGLAVALAHAGAENLHRLPQLVR